VLSWTRSVFKVVGLFGYVGYRTDVCVDCCKTLAMIEEAIDPGFYILASFSAAIAVVFVVSHWFV